jgi:hypothetical protein
MLNVSIAVAFFLWYWRDICEEIDVPCDRLEHPGNPSPAHSIPEAHKLQTK